MENNFYPTGMETGKMKLPVGTNLGKIKADSVMAYGKTEVIISPINEQPICFIDLESPREEYKVMKEKLLHFGFMTNFNIKSNYGNSKPRIDFYIPISEIDNLIAILQNKKKEFNPNDWNKVLCEWCGEHARCPKCNKYIWKEKDVKQTN